MRSSSRRRITRIVRSRLPLLSGKHVMCEKPLGLNAGEVREMYDAARDAGVVHMTAFTYRFAPVDAVSAAPGDERSAR